MNIELLPGLTNVIRFPIELRAAPSMDVLYEIEPDSREVSLIAESYMLELPEPELFDLVDQETALHIARTSCRWPQPSRRPPWRRCSTRW